MGVATSTSRLVEQLRAVVELHVGPSEVIEGLSEAGVTGSAHADRGVFAALAGDGGDAGMGAKGVVISARERFRRLCEHRGNDDPPGSWQRTEDRSIPVLAPFLAFGERLFHCLEERLYLAFADSLLSDQRLDHRQFDGDSAGDCFTDAGPHRQGGLAQGGAQLAGGEASDAMLAEQFGERRDRQPATLDRRRNALEERPEPRFIRARSEFEKLWPDSLEAFTQAVGGAQQVSVQARLLACELTQENEILRLGLDPPEAV